MDGHDMRLTISNEIIVTEPTDDMRIWVRDNLTLRNPDFDKKLRLGLWLGGTPQQINLYTTRGSEIHLPYGSLSLMPDELLQECTIIDNFRAHTAVDFKAQIPLYPYQRTAVSKMVLEGGGILRAPAGSGKTQMGLSIIAELKCKTLWICHTLDLIKQSKDRASLYMDKSLFGTITGGKVDIGEGITFATVQTLSSIDLDAHKDEWECIVVDECHRVSGSPTSVTRYQKVLSRLSARYKYGLSATVHRADGLIQATKALIGKVEYTVPDEAVVDTTMQVGIHPISTRVGMSDKCLNGDGTINYSKLISYLCDNQYRCDLIADYISAERRPTLILSDRIEHLISLQAKLPIVLQLQSVVINGKTKKDIRERALDDMRQGKLLYLFATYALAKEGLDIPRLERLFLTTPQKDYAIVTQSVGRIARKTQGKDNPIVYDFVDNIRYLVNSYKQRCGVYRKNNCYFVETL
jgi:superfamily II DNA or RNA helicase